MGHAEGEIAELLVDVVEDRAWLEEELARDAVSASQAAVWFSCPLGQCCTAAASFLSSLVRQGTAQVSLVQTIADDNGGVGVSGHSSKQRWLPARILDRSFLARDATPAGGGSQAQDGDASRTHSRRCSAILSPCLAEALGLFPPSTHDATSRIAGTSASGRIRSANSQQLSLRELPSSLVAPAAAVELSGPYPASAATGRLGVFSGSNGAQAFKPAQQKAQLAAAVSSILPCALDGHVVAEGSIVRVAGLFGLIVTGVRTEEERHGGPLAEKKGEEAGNPRSNPGAGPAVVKVRGSTELRLSPPTRLGRVGVAVDNNGFSDEDVGDGGDTAAAAGRLTARSSCRWQQASPGHLDLAASPAATCSGPVAAGLSPAPPPYSSLDAREWIRRVEQDFGGLGDQVATAIVAVGTALRGGRRGRHRGRGGELTAPASGLLLHGPTGVGKTLLARSIAKHSGAPWFLLDCASVFRRDRGKAEQYVQDFLTKAGERSPSVVVLDQIESVCRRRPEAAGITELQVFSVLVETMDRFRRSSSSSRVFFLATCPDSTALDPSLLQRGRLEAVLRLGALDSAARASVLGIHARGMHLALLPPPSSTTVDTDASVARTREELLRLVAARCHGYLGSDLERLCREAAMIHMSTSVTSKACAQTNAAPAGATTATPAHGSYDAGRRHGGVAEGIRCLEANDDREENWSGISGRGGSGVRLQDFWSALNVVRPASLVGHSVGVWGGDVRHQRGETVTPTPLVGCDAAMAELRAFIVTPLANPSLLRDLGLSGATGALLHGPPGCGKTSVARALAVEVQGVANFLEVKCSDLVDKVVGRSEKNVSDLFAAARAAAPCVLFLDQVEGVAARRGYHSSTEQTFDRILSTLLVEMDGVMSESGGHVVVLAATNDIERLDPALLRPGRLDRRVYLGNPDSAARTAIFLQRLTSMPLQMEGGNVDEEGGDAEEHGRGVGSEHPARDTTAAFTTKDAASGIALDGAEGNSAQCLGQRSTGGGVDGINDMFGSRVLPQPRSPRRRGLLDSTEAYAEWLAGETEGRSGAHVTGVCREAALAALREGIGAAVVAPRHFEAVLGGR